MTKKGFEASGLDRAINRTEGAIDALTGAAEEQETATGGEQVKKGNTLVSFRMDNEVLHRFRGFAVQTGATQIEAIERIITAYLDGETIDPAAS